MRQYLVDAFADDVFQGNPAAVCLLARWPEEVWLQNVARENGQPETAFLVPGQQENEYSLRWFSPEMEVDLCGHATLAAAYVVFHFLERDASEVIFQTKSGPLLVRRRGELLEMDLPAYTLKPLEVTDAIVDALGVRPKEVWRARDLVCVFEREEDVLNMRPDLEKVKALKGALMQVTAPGTKYDCITRTFAPKMGLAEDPVCGSGHCHVIPYWTQRLGRKELVARQASQRGGTLYCRMEGDRIFIAGRAVVYAQCELMLEEPK
ncbi:MAG: PhzF family phenazine biosynthesis protein [Lawsonibacter sp.]